MRKTMILILIILPLQLIYGCAETLVYTIGKVHLDKEKANIYITEDNNVVSNCQFKKSIESNTYWGGALLQDEALNRVISDASHEAYASGANVLLIKSQKKSFMGSTVLCDAYYCAKIDNTLIKP